MPSPVAIDPSHYAVVSAMITPAFFLTAASSLLISSNNRLARVVDRMRSEIEVLPGRRTPVLAYAVESGGRKFLNPALLARKGDQMRVKLINRIDQPTVIHWHGLGVDSRNDGNGLQVVAPGQSMGCAFTVQDRSSMYWYHPHAHGFIPQQAYHGLASLLFVEDEDEVALRKELALVTAEISTTVRDAKRGVAAVATGAAVLFAGFLLLLGALTAGLAQAMPVWLSSLIVGVVTVIVGYVLLAAGKKKVKPAR